MLVRPVLAAILMVSASLARPVQLGASLGQDGDCMAGLNGSDCSAPGEKRGNSVARGIAPPYQQPPAPLDRRAVEDFFNNLPRSEKDEIAARMIEVVHRHTQRSSLDTAPDTPQEKGENVESHNISHSEEHIRKSTLSPTPNTSLHPHHKKRWLQAIFMALTILPIALPILQPALNMVKPLIAPIMAPVMGMLNPFTSMVFPIAEQLVPGITSLLTFRKRALEPADTAHQELARILEETWDKHHPLETSGPSKRNLEYDLY